MEPTLMIAALAFPHHGQNHHPASVTTATTTATAMTTSGQRGSGSPKPVVRSRPLSIP